LYTEGNVAPLFSLAIERASSTNGIGSQLALGGLPPIDFFPNFACVPFQLLTMMDAVAPATVPQYQFYIITAYGFSYSESNTTSG